MARRGSYLSRQSARAVSRYALPERAEPTVDVFAASVFCQRWEHAVTHTATTFYVLALSPEHALILGRIRLEKMGGADHLALVSSTRMDGYGWAFTEMVLQSESQEEKDARVALWHEQHPHRVCMECGVPWNGIHRGCSCDAPPNIPVSKAEYHAAVMGTWGA